MTLEEAFVLNQPQIKAVEHQYRLPRIRGRTPERRWARLVRADFFRELFDGIDQVAAQDRDVIKVVSEISAEDRADQWIDQYFRYLRAVVSHVLALAGAKAKSRQKNEEWQRKAQETLRINREAARFEEQYGLPRITSKANSTRQENFGSRCRYLMLRDMEPSRIAEVHPLLAGLTDAGIWIGAHRRQLLLEQVMGKCGGKQGMAA